MVDFLGNEINVGYSAIVISQNLLVVVNVVKFGGSRIYVNGLNEKWWQEYYFRQPETVISLTALGYKKKENIELMCDVLGNKINVGDTIVANIENIFSYRQSV